MRKMRMRMRMRGTIDAHVGDTEKKRMKSMKMKMKMKRDIYNHSHPESKYTNRRRHVSISIIEKREEGKKELLERRKKKNEKNIKLEQKGRRGSMTSNIIRQTPTPTPTQIPISYLHHHEQIYHLFKFITNSHIKFVIKSIIKSNKATIKSRQLNRRRNPDELFETKIR